MLRDDFTIYIFSANLYSRIFQLNIKAASSSMFATKHNNLLSNRLKKLVVVHAAINSQTGGSHILTFLENYRTSYFP